MFIPFYTHNLTYSILSLYALKVKGIVKEKTDCSKFYAIFTQTKETGEKQREVFHYTCVFSLKKDVFCIHGHKISS